MYTYTKKLCDPLQYIAGNSKKQSGAVEACWAHNPEVRGSKPRSAIFRTIDFFSKYQRDGYLNRGTQKTFKVILFFSENRI